MKFTFKVAWLQNVILGSLLIGVILLIVQQRETVHAAASEELFFLAVLTIALLATGTLYLLLTINTRVEAQADERTSNLLETQKLFVELYRNSPVPYVMVDHRGRVTYPNHAALHLFGLEETSFEGRNIFDMFEVLDDEEGLRTSMVFSRFSTGVFVDNKDILILREDGTTRFGLLSIFPYGEFGHKKKGLMTIVDITKQKEIEQAKTEFVSLASHQLRTPVSSMKWNLELMASPRFGTITQKQHEYFIKITNSLKKMNSLIDDFLNVSQLELGTKRAHFETVELLPFFEGICNEFDGRVAEYNLTLTRQFDNRITSIETDRTLLHMAVSNLVSNATKYTLKNGTVRVQYAAGYDSLTIVVADTGVGIPPDDVEKLFTKFFRAANVRKHVSGGTGLGLYIVKLAVEKMGGTISVQSKEGEGTVFQIVLPYSGHGRVTDPQ